MDVQLKANLSPPVREGHGFAASYTMNHLSCDRFSGLRLYSSGLRMFGLTSHGLCLEKMYSSGLKSQESAKTLITGILLYLSCSFFDLSYFERFGCSAAVNSVQSIRDPLYTLY